MTAARDESRPTRPDLVLFAAALAALSAGAWTAALLLPDRRAESPDPYRGAVAGCAAGVGLSAGFVAAGLAAPLGFRPAREPFRSAAAWGGLGLALLGLAGAALSQAAPLFGPLPGRLAPPGTVARLNLIPGHVFALGLAGLVAGGLAGHSAARSRPAD